MKSVGIIGGSGFYELLGNPRISIHNNKYECSPGISEEAIQKHRVYFLLRHGEEHKIIVLRINYRADIWALKELGVEQILATDCAGSSDPDIELGSLVIPHGFCNWIRRLPRSLCDGKAETYYVDVTPAYCPDLRKALAQAANQVKPGHVHDQAAILVNEGFRFETPLELKMSRKLGADLIGMTTLPKAMFARGAAICYAHTCVPTNWCLGEQIEADDLSRLLKQGIEDFKQVLHLATPILSDDRGYPCSHALDHAILKR